MAEVAAPARPTSKTDDPYDAYRSGGASRQPTPPAAQPADEADVHRAYQQSGQPTAAGSPVGAGEPTIWSEGTAVASQLKEGLANVLGLPIDAVSSALRAVGLDVGPSPVGGSKSIQGLLGVSGREPQTGVGQFAGRVAQEVGAGAAGVGVVGTAARAAHGLASVPGVMGQALRRLAGLDLAALTRIELYTSIASGSGAATARSVTGSDRPWADLAGQLVGMFGFNGARGLIDVARRHVGRGPERVAAQALATEVPSGSAAEARLDQAIQMRAQQPEVMITTGQATGAPGIRRLEREYAVSTPGVGGRIQEGREASSAAITRQIRAEAPTGPGTVAEAQARVRQATGARVSAAEAAIEAETKAIQQQADTLAARTTAELDGLRQSFRVSSREPGSPSHRAELSQALYTRLEELRDAARKRAYGFFDRVDPDDTTTVPTEDLRAALESVVARERRLKRTAPAYIVTLAEGLPDDAAVSFNLVRGWRSELAAEESLARRQLVPDPRTIRDLSEARRAFDDILDQAGAASEAYQAAKAQYHDFMTRYEKGVLASLWRPGVHGEEHRIAVESIAGHLFAPNRQNGLTRAQNFKDAAGQDAVANQAYAEYALRTLVDVAADGRKGLSGTAAKEWFRQHSEALSVFPDLRRQAGLMVQTLSKAADKTDAAERLRRLIDKGQIPPGVHPSVILERTVADAEDKAVRFFVRADPREAIGALLRRTDRDQRAHQLVSVTRGDDTAMNGLRRGLVETMSDTIRKSAAEPTGSILLSPDKMRAFMEQHDGVFRAFYPGEAMDRLHTLQRAAEMSLRPASFEGAAPGLLRGVSRESLWTVDMLLSRAWGVARNVVGVPYTATDISVRVMTQAFNQIGTERMRMILDRMLFDPEAARVMLDLGRRELAAEARLQSLRAYAASIAPVATAPGGGVERFRDRSP